MKFNEAIQAIGTTSVDVEGVPKRVGKKVVRRPVPAGYIADVRKPKKKNKKQDDEDEEDVEEELKEMLKQLPKAIGWHNMSKFWDKGVQYADADMEDDEDEEDDDDDPEEMAAPTRPVLPNYQNRMTDKFWKWDDEEDEDEPEEGRQITREFGSGYPRREMDPFWRKNHRPLRWINSEVNDDDEEEEKEDEES